MHKEHFDDDFVQIFQLDLKLTVPESEFVLMCLLSCLMLIAKSFVLVKFPLCANAIPNGAFVYKGCASAEQPLPPGMRL